MCVWHFRQWTKPVKPGRKPPPPKLNKYSGVKYELEQTVHNERSDVLSQNCTHLRMSYFRALFLQCLTCFMETVCDMKRKDCVGETSWNVPNSRRKRRHMAIFCFALFHFALLCFFFFPLYLHETLLLFTHSLCIIFLLVLFLPRRNVSNVYLRVSLCVPLTQYIKSIHSLQVPYSVS